MHHLSNLCYWEWCPQVTRAWMLAAVVCWHVVYSLSCTNALHGWVRLLWQGDGYCGSAPQCCWCGSALEASQTAEAGVGLCLHDCWVTPVTWVFLSETNPNRQLRVSLSLCLSRLLPVKPSLSSQGLRREHCKYLHLLLLRSHTALWCLLWTKHSQNEL